MARRSTRPVLATECGKSLPQDATDLEPGTLCVRCSDHDQSGLFFGLPKTPCSLCAALKATPQRAKIRTD